MEILYLWIRNYKNINHKGFNLSSKITFETIVESLLPEDTLEISINEYEGDLSFNIFPDNIIDIKAIIGENGSGKTNLMFSILDFFLSKTSNLKGFLITTESIIVRDKINFKKVPEKILNKKISYIFPEDIFNFNNNSSKNKLERKDVFYKYKSNLMETYFEKNYIIYYSPFLNLDNVHNIDNIENDYSKWENQRANFINISTESTIISDYQTLNNNDSYLITGESELLAFKYEESKRILNFLKVVNDYNFKIKFPIFSIGIEFTNFSNRFWKSIDKIISPNSSGSKHQIEEILNFDLQQVKSDQEYFFKFLSQSITYCFLSYELKTYYNFSTEEEFPIVKLVNNLKANYDSKLDNFKALSDYILKTEIYGEAKNLIVNDLTNIKEYFEIKFKSKEIICNGMFGFIIPKSSINKLIEDFLSPPLSYIPVSNDQSVVLNMFGFNFNGLSSGERNFLSLFSRINIYKERFIKKNRNILFLIDEGEIGFHPQWQKMYLKILFDFLENFFPNNNIQLIISTHSPFLVSDLPKENIIFLKKDKNKMTEISDIKNHKLTFGANINDILANDFFLQNGFMGEFANEIIESIIGVLNYFRFLILKTNLEKDENMDEKIKEEEITKINLEIKLLKNKNSLEVSIKDIENEKKNGKILKTINIIGEPIIRYKLLEMYDEIFLENRKNVRIEKIKRLMRENGVTNEDLRL
ncbi:MAG: AAA family ATPase [Flavobacterium sp.]|uniref:AAA family ATPase n=1 Tax=Flavobacterium sp. TaxID=239 RepID=UPI003D0CC75F